MFGQLKRIAADPHNERVAYADLTEICARNTHQACEFSLVVINSSGQLLECEIGDLVIVHGTFSRNLRGDQRIAVMDVQRLVFDGDQQQAESANTSEGTINDCSH